ncbi:hypothetical protein ACQEVB_25775 [Pseudonocardia sp. CA-107938]|uniref:hypothetical protein n=1 Tax=Pseudonocardia sp. CA-107938 TaxID=3240021 RepID=UPI003D8FE99C
MTTPQETGSTAEDLDTTHARLVAAADRGDENARVELGWLCELLGRRDTAEAHYRRIDRNPVALRNLWLLQARTGHPTLAEMYRGLAAKAGDEYAGRREHRSLPEQHAKQIFRHRSQSWYEHVERRYRPLAEAGDPRAMRILGEAAEGRGDTFGAADWLGRAAAAGEPVALARAAKERRSTAVGRGVLLVLGALVAAGVGMWLVQPDPAPTVSAPVCDGQTMGPGDECIVLRGGGESFTYEQRMAEQTAARSAWKGDQPGDEVAGWLLIAGGVVAAAGGAGMVARGGRS